MITTTIQQLREFKTPFYHYDLELLDKTLRVAVQEANRHGFYLHYALKANANPRLLAVIREHGIGADCVSGNEITAAIESGFPADGIVYAGVGKSDEEIQLALQQEIGGFNCESFPELEVISQLAAASGKTARVSLRVNPGVDACTHHYITTGIEENKFGFPLDDVREATQRCLSLPNIEWTGLHFHVGSQITGDEVFRELCNRVNEIQRDLAATGLVPARVNFGGGLGVDYDDPDARPVADFAGYFRVFAEHFKRLPGQQVHFEPGRSIVAQCGSLVARVLYVKEGKNKKFVILDAGMNDLIRPALYQAHHRVENLSAAGTGALEPYDVVGPVCESADCFGEALLLPPTRRGDLVAIRSCGAYGEVMASRYNLRPLAPARFF
ncbi:MAG: diaminopimelate decarboxylase [Odoribacteraceae bacterium]|jgi:diaminopimelate decarboxylase|nr:diaminopimelate decarboxylase [Odoribacteraceae bacterium]